MPNYGALLPVLLAIIVGLVSVRIWQSASNRMKLKFPINGKYADTADQLSKNIRFRSSIEHFPVSYEIISDANLTSYIDLLLYQHKNSDRAIRDYIQRIPFTEQSQQFFRSVSTGWYNAFSITLIAREKFNGHHKIILAQLSKEVTISIFQKLLSPIASLLGMTSSEQQQLEKIMANLNQEENKQTMENMMMFTMADSLRNRFGDVLNISYVKKK